MGMVGNFITTKVLLKLEPWLENQMLKAISLRWGIGFAFGGLLGGLGGFFSGFIILVFFDLQGAIKDAILAIALALGFAIMGYCGCLIGGRFMLKRLGEYASSRDTVRSG